MVKCSCPVDSGCDQKVSLNEGIIGQDARNRGGSTVNAEDERPARKWWVKNIITLCIVAAVLFLSSGTITWVMAWIYVFILTVITLANALAMDPGLMAERSKLQEGTKRWDVLLSTFVAIWGPLLVWVTAGLDVRLGWSRGILPGLQIAALVLLLLAGLLGTWAMAANQFFSSTVRIQSERDHRVVSEGPYRYIRHPGYTGGIAAMLATAVALGSWFALIPGTLVGCGYLLRTGLEDRVLQEELEGYREYSQKVRYRLLPGVW
jgi:protein-S-isoprenylcysteine O-methyltransferase Ste14